MYHSMRIHCYYTESLLALTGVLSGVLFVNFTVKRLFNHKLLNLKMHKLIQRQKCSEIPVQKKVTFTKSHQKPEFCSFSERFHFNNFNQFVPLYSVTKTHKPKVELSFLDYLCGANFNQICHNAL